MKKLLYLTLFCFIAQINIVLAEQPIPAKHFPIHHMANFCEQNNGTSRNPFLVKSTKEKRDMEIQASTATSGPKVAVIVYVYSEDLQDIEGPFTVDSGDNLSVPIDDRDWGVVVISDDHVYVDVWTSDSSGT